MVYAVACQLFLHFHVSERRHLNGYRSLFFPFNLSREKQLKMMYSSYRGLRHLVLASKT
jgi:hypothetical protein